MQNSEKWMTVKEFAMTAGVSDKAVYDRLKKDLKVYLKNENGRKYIHSDALRFVGIQANSSENQADSIQALNETQVDSSKFQVLEHELEETKIELNAANSQISAQNIEIDRLNKELESALNDLKRTSADLESAQEQRQKAEIRAAAAEATAAAECKRADAAEQQCKVKDEQAAHSAQTVIALTTALQTAQQQAENLTKALDNSQALQAGQIRLAMQDGEQDLPVDQQQKKKRGLFGGLFHKGNKDG